MSIFFIRIISGENGATEVSYSVVARRVAAFLGIPPGAAVLTRFSLRKIFGKAWYDGIFIKFSSPLSLIGLLCTIMVLFASQAHQVVHQIVSVVRVAAPLIVYFVIISFATLLLLARRVGFGYPCRRPRASRRPATTLGWPSPWPLPRTVRAVTNLWRRR